MNDTVVISGANRGIGLALCRDYLNQGAKVIALCRSPSDALAASGAKVIDGVDVCDPAGLSTLAERLDVPAIDVLINNAGVLFEDSLEHMDAQAIEHMRTQFEVNTLGPLHLTLALRPLLKKGSKAAIITSVMGSMTDNTSGGYYGYRASKAAVNMVGRSLAVDLRDDGIIVGLVHPGYVRTDMTGGNGHIEPQESARGIARVIADLTAERSGEFRHSSGDELPW
ncbi:MAG: SDR family oxidoreductase [Pseudomonadota bacterium]